MQNFSIGYRSKSEISQATQSEGVTTRNVGICILFFCFFLIYL